MLVRWPEIREVQNPVSPAVAFTENGRTVVEVDEKLRGKARAVAIWAAVRLHEGGLPALVGLPILAIAWEPFKRWAQKHPGAAMAATTATGSALTAGVALVLPMLLDGAQESKIAEPSVILTSALYSPWQSPSATRKPTREPTGSATRNQDRPEPTARPVTRPASQPAGTPTRSVRPRPAATTEPPATEQRSTPNPAPQGEPADPTPHPSSAVPPPAGEASAAGPPAPTAAAEGCLLQADVDPLLEACVLD